MNCEDLQKALYLPSVKPSAFKESSSTGSFERVKTQFNRIIWDFIINIFNEIEDILMNVLLTQYSLQHVLLEDTCAGKTGGGILISVSLGWSCFSGTCKVPHE